MKATVDTFQPGMPSFGYALERRHQSRESWRGSIPPFRRRPNRLEGCCDSLTLPPVPATSTAFRTTTPNDESELFRGILNLPDALSNNQVSSSTPSCEESRRRRWTMGLASARVAQHLRASSEMTAIRDGVGAFLEATAAQPISATRIMTHGHDSERLSLPRAGPSSLSAFTK